MVLFYQILADVVVALHLGYVSFVVVGELAILVGWFLRWKWTCGVPFRMAHLAAIVLVALEAWCGITCPLTTWEQWLREKGGQATDGGDFIATRLHHILFYDFPPWVFTTCYSAFAAMVVLTLVLVPPKRRSVSDSLG